MHRTQETRSSSSKVHFICDMVSNVKLESEGCQGTHSYLEPLAPSACPSGAPIHCVLRLP